MLRRTGAIIIALLLVGLLGVPAHANVDDEHSKRDDEQTLTFFAKEAAFTFITAEGEVFTDEEADVATDGEEEEGFAPQPGDRFVGVDTVFADEALTEEVGRNDFECSVTDAHGDFPEDDNGDVSKESSGESEDGEEPDFFASLNCSGVVTLDEQGSLAWQGATTFPPAEEEGPFITVAITGGTGEFLGASGEAAISEVDDEGRTRYDVTLLHAMDDDD